eukprot:954373-Pelagomonas_calceolata.AAC.2
MQAKDTGCRILAPVLASSHSGIVKKGIQCLMNAPLIASFPGRTKKCMQHSYVHNWNLMHVDQTSSIS